MLVADFDGMFPLIDQNTFNLILWSKLKGRRGSEGDLA